MKYIISNTTKEKINQIAKELNKQISYNKIPKVPFYSILEIDVIPDVMREKITPLWGTYTEVDPVIENNKELTVQLIEAVRKDSPYILMV